MRTAALAAMSHHPGAARYGGRHPAKEQQARSLARAITTPRQGPTPHAMAAAPCVTDARGSAVGMALQPAPPDPVLGTLLGDSTTALPLPATTRSYFERRLGTDLSGVRLHQGEAAARAAAEVGARAFATGSHLVFGRTAPPLQGAAGEQLLAHELAHVVLGHDGINRYDELESTPAAAVAAPPVLWGLDTASRRTYLSVTLPGHSIEAVASYLYGSSSSSAEGMRRANGALPSGTLPAGTTLRPSGEQLAERAGQALQHALRGGTILRSEGVPVAPEESAQGYRFSANGQTFELTRGQLDGMLQGLAVYLTRQARYLRGRAQDGLAVQGSHVQETNGLVRGISNLIAGQDLPPESSWEVPAAGAQMLIDALQAGPLTPQLIATQARVLAVVARGVDDAYRSWHRYIEGTIAGAQGAVNALEITRDLSFGIAIGIGAVVAFPVVAGAAATTLGTGTVASGAVAAGGVTLGGGVVGGAARGSTRLVGQALTDGPVDLGEVRREALAGFTRGGIDAATSLIGMGLGRGLFGLATRSLPLAGEFATTGQRMLLQGVAHGGAGLVAGGFHGGSSALTEGGTPSQAWARARQSALLGLGLGAASPLLGALLGRLFPYQFGSGARPFRITPHVSGEIFPGEAQGLGLALRNLFAGARPADALRAVRETINPNLRWQRLLAMPDLTMEQFTAPRPGDVLLFGPYGRGQVIVVTNGQRELVNVDSLFFNQHFPRGPRLGAATLGWEENVVSNEARRIWSQQQDMGRIIAEEMPYIARARHIYFFTTRDMHLRPITWREFEIIMDSLALRAKTTFIPLD